MKPHTQYTKSGSINIAYQVFGSGSVDLVYIPGWVSNIDLMWECPELVDFFQELGKIARVILFDKRGTGLSDRITELSTLEERMDDIRAVMDAVSSQKAVLFGHSEGGSVSALFAATYPNRTISLIAFGIFAKRRYSEDYPWAPTDEERQKVYDMIDTSWGGGEMNLATLAPSKAKDKKFMEWLAHYFRSGASPSAAMVLTKMNTQVDIINILSSIRVPTLLMQRTNDIDVKIEEGRFIAKRIKGARFVELPGEDHLFWAGNTAEIINEMSAFILNTKMGEMIEVQLFTILIVKVEISQSTYAAIFKELEQIMHQYRGTIFYNQDGYVMATFNGPSKAAYCSINLVKAAGNVIGSISAGIHIMESKVSEAHMLTGKTERLLKHMISRARARQVLVTQTVKNLLSGAGLSFAKLKTTSLSTTVTLDGLFEITNVLEEEPIPHLANEISVPHYSDSLFEDVLSCINQHISDERFDVNVICKELGISERQLQRKLKAITNKSPVQLITSVRLHRAKELLVLKELNISEAAYKAGFSSSSYFSKCFKLEFGETPSAFLKKS